LVVAVVVTTFAIADTAFVVVVNTQVVRDLNFASSVAFEFPQSIGLYFEDLACMQSVRE